MSPSSIFSSSIFYFSTEQVTLRNAYAQVFVTSGLQGNQEPCWCGEIQNLFLWRSSSFLHSKKSVAKSCKQYSYKRFLSTSVATFIPSIGLMQYFLCFHFFHSCASPIKKCASQNCHDTWFARQTRNALMWPDPKPSFAAFVFFSCNKKIVAKSDQQYHYKKFFLGIGSQRSHLLFGALGGAFAVDGSISSYEFRHTGHLWNLIWGLELPSC